MADRIRIGVLGLVHDHIWDNLNHLPALEDVQLVAAADLNKPLLEQFSSRTECEKTYTDFEEMLDKEDLDAAFVYGTNRTTADLVDLAAEKRLHVMCEKPMASSLDVADRMLTAARRAGVLLMINWPIAWSPGVCHAYDLVCEGAIGRVWQLKWRGGHCGPKELGCSEYFYEWLYDPIENGGGALFDYLGYGASLARLFIGVPARVTAIAGRLVKDYIPVDDNAIVALEYQDANAVIECTWTEPVPGRPPHDVILYGTEGVMLASGKSVRIYKRGEDDQEIEPPALKAPRRNGPEYFVHCIRNGQPIEGICSPENAHDAQEIMEAARLSVLTGRHISLPLVDHLYSF